MEPTHVSTFINPLVESITSSFSIGQDSHSPEAGQRDEVSILKSKVFAMVRDISSDQKLVETFIRFVSQFHRYSLWNTILIFLQYPEASQVAGFRSWQSLGRWVRKGEKGIKIFAPIVKTLERIDMATGEVVKTRMLQGFKVVTVFALEQTDGKALEVPPMGTLIVDDPDAILKRLKALAASEGIQVHEVAMRVSLGGKTDGKAIWLNTLVGTSGNIMTLLHELGHVMLGHSVERKTIPTGQMEVEAELVAFFTALSLGIPRGSHQYIQRWTQETDVPDEAIEYSLRIAERLTRKLNEKRDHVTV